MLFGVRARILRKRRLLHRNVAERRAHRGRARERQAAQRREVRRAEQHDAADRRILDAAECGSRDGARIDVAGVRRDERLRRRPVLRTREQARHRLAELRRVGGIEAAGDGRCAHRLHSTSIRLDRRHVA